MKTHILGGRKRVRACMGALMRVCECEHALRCEREEESEKEMQKKH